jgi:TetR/AcrR family transcriptional repressor of nem operon
MRVSKEQAQASRQRIVQKAAALFRVRGFEGIGVADLMKASGMTHGGFYRHFTSKDDLVREASAAAYDQLERETQGKTIEALLTRYMSAEHRDDFANGCPTSALGSDAMRQPQPVQEVFARRVETWLRMIEDALEAEKHLNPSERRELSIDLAARAVGAVILSRASALQPVLSKEILASALKTSLAETKEQDKLSA